MNLSYRIHAKESCYACPKEGTDITQLACIPRGPIALRRGCPLSPRTWSILKNRSSRGPFSLLEKPCFEVMLSSSEALGSASRTCFPPRSGWRPGSHKVPLNPIEHMVLGKLKRPSPSKVWYLRSGPSRWPWDGDLVYSNNRYVTGSLLKKNMDRFHWIDFWT